MSIMLHFAIHLKSKVLVFPLCFKGGAAQFGGAHPRSIATNPDGTLPLELIRAAVRGDDQHFPITKLLCLENTHNMRGGVVLPTEYVRDASQVARDAGIQVHIDGARIWHAAAHLGESLAAVSEPADSLSVCLSKALGAPAGSVVVGDASLVAKGRRLRKGLGGTMRQSGVLAAAGLHALDEHLPNLGDDHRRAAELSRALADTGAFHVEPSDTNLVFFSVDPVKAGLDADELVAAAQAQGVRFLKISGDRMRMVLHHQVDDEGLARAIGAIQSALADPIRAREQITNGRPGSGGSYAGGPKR